MLIPHKGHTDTIQVYSVTVMTHVKALQAGHSSQGTSEPITPVAFHIRHFWFTAFHISLRRSNFAKVPKCDKMTVNISRVVSLKQNSYNVTHYSHGITQYMYLYTIFYSQGNQPAIACDNL